MRIGAPRARSAGRAEGPRERQTRTAQFEVHEVEETGDWAWARTSSAGRARILAAGLDVTEGNNELFVFRREGGDWRIHRYLFSTNQPRA